MIFAAILSERRHKIATYLYRSRHRACFGTNIVNIEMMREGEGAQTFYKYYSIYILLALNIILFI